ncbi:MAG: replicative DNA helicase [Patescibacteria group bacterium]|nr:replicative DNA helicase [Patescibacteria group bacterium]
MADKSPRIPPHSQEAEESVVGSLLLDKDAIVAVAEFLSPDDFYDGRLKEVYLVALELFDERIPIDVLTISERLKKKKLLKSIGGLTFLTNLSNKVPTTAHVEHYGRIVRDFAIKRSLLKTASKLVEMSTDDSMSVSELLDKAESEVYSLSTQSSSKGFEHIKNVLTVSFDRLDELYKNPGEMRGVATGFADLDKTLSGLQPSNLIILAARPGVGKTALALNIASYVAVKNKKPVGFFSLEMSKEELNDRLLVAHAEIDSWKLKTGRLTEDEFAKLSEAMGILYDAPIFIDDTPALSILEMRSRARRLQVEQGLELLIVDYLQLARSRNLENRVQEVGEISQGLKNLARELKIPVLALSQLSRAVEHRGEKKPQLADLRESGSIEQDADVVMFLYREDDENMNNIALDVAKHRNGPLASIKLFFKGDQVKFYSRETARA